MSDTSYPVIEPDGEELFFQNAWRTDQEQTLGDTECFNFDAQPSVTENLIVMKLTGQQLTEMLSALYIGAEFVYPEKYLEVLRPLLAATSCPPILEEQECFEYPTYASFLRYTPMNPYINPNDIPDGYQVEPFAVNGENGNNFPGYEHYDVIVPSSSVTFDLDWFETLNGQLPTIEVMVQGQGTVFLKMLTVGGGGLAVITLDNPPDLLDIIAGIVTASENIIDLNQDLVSLPPETAQELIFKVETGGPGLHTIYIVFLPILDDSLTPIRFGGGFRGVQLCDFVEQPDVGISSLRFENCNLEQLVDGEWSIVPGWEDWLDCVPSGGGGGGVSTLKTTIYSFELPANQDTTSTVNFVEAPGTVQAHQFTRSKALIFAEFQLLNTNAGSNAFAFVAVNDNPPGQNGVERIGGNSGETLYVTGGFESLDTVNSSSLSIYFRANANTARIGTGSRLIYTILEYEDASELFVEDIRIFEGELQKRIGGAWIPVTDSFEAIITNLQGQINTATALAAVAQSAAAAAQTTANGAVTMNNNQNIRLTAIENWQDIADARFTAIDAINTNQQTRIENLEGMSDILSFGNAWAWLHDMTVITGGYAASVGSYSGGVGFVSDGNGVLQISNVATLQENQLTHVEVTVLPTGLFGGGPYGIRFAVMDTTDFASIHFTAVGNLAKGWIRIPNTFAAPNVLVRIEGAGVNFILKQVRYLGRGFNVPFD